MTEQNMQAWNQQVIEEFRANRGHVGGSFENMTLLLLTTTGAKSGQVRITPLTYLRENERLFIFAANGGSTTSPGWYYNLMVQPEVTVEIDAEQFVAEAILLKGEEREQIYAREIQRHPGIAEYERRAHRKIPVVELIRRNNISSH